MCILIKCLIKNKQLKCGKGLEIQTSSDNIDVITSMFRDDQSYLQVPGLSDIFPQHVHSYFVKHPHLD